MEPNWAEINRPVDIGVAEHSSLTEVNDPNKQRTQSSQRTQTERESEVI